MKLRRLTEGECALAGRVFGVALDLKQVRILTGAPTGPWAMVLFCVMVFPVEVADFSREPLHRRGWFVHELTHLWQFQTRPLWTFRSWARTALGGGYLDRRAYRYDLPVRWSGLNLEQQAMVVEHAFLLRQGARSPDVPPGAVSADYDIGEIDFTSTL